MLASQALARFPQEEVPPALSLQPGKPQSNTGSPSRRWIWGKHTVLTGRRPDVSGGNPATH